MTIREFLSIGSLGGTYLQQEFRESVKRSSLGRMTHYCVFVFDLQRTPLRREGARVLEGEMETFKLSSAF
jgi:hypothetical protein